MQVCHSQVYAGIADISDVVEVFQPFDDHVTHHARGDLGAPQLLQAGFHLVDERLDLLCGDGAFRAGGAHPLDQLLPVEFLAGGIPFDDQGRLADEAFVGGIALAALFALAASADAPLGIMGRVDDFGFFRLTIRTAQGTSPGIKNWFPLGYRLGEVLGFELLPPYLGAKLSIHPISTMESF